MSDEPRARLTELLHALRDGRDGARDAFYEGVYAELRALARREFRGEVDRHTLQPTALVNEAWLRLAASEQDFESRAHFFGSAARAMRRILIDHARAAQAAKRGGREEVVTLTDVEDARRELAVLEVDGALSALEAHDERLADVVQLRFFGGLTIEEIAAVRGLSPATVKRDWTYARAWLFAHMDEAEA